MTYYDPGNVDNDVLRFIRGCGRFIKGFLFVAFIAYLFGCLLSWNTDPKKWMLVLDIVVCGCGGIAALFAGINYADIGPDE